MSDQEQDLLEVALELMRHASTAFHTVTGTLHVSRDPEAAQVAWRRRKSFSRSPVHAVEVTITDEMRARLPRKFQVVVPDEADGRLWVRHPWILRVEGQIGWDQHPWGARLWEGVEIHYRHYSWEWDLKRRRYGPPCGPRGARPGGPVELFDPRRVLRHWTLAPLGVARIAGRPTIRLRAMPDPPDADLYSLDMLNHLAPIGEASDAWELDVDRERGILLRLAAEVEGSPYLTVEFTSIMFDDPIAEDVFTFADCAGAEQEPPLWHQRHHSLEDWDPFLP